MAYDWLDPYGAGLSLGSSRRRSGGRRSRAYERYERARVRRAKSQYRYRRSRERSAFYSLMVGEERRRASRRNDVTRAALGRQRELRTEPILGSNRTEVRAQIARRRAERQRGRYERELRRERRAERRYRRSVGWRRYL